MQVRVRFDRVRFDSGHQRGRRAGPEPVDERVDGVLVSLDEDLDLPGSQVPDPSVEVSLSRFTTGGLTKRDALDPA